MINHCEPWSDEEKAFVKENLAEMSMRVIAIEIGRSKIAVKNKIIEMRKRGEME